ncbi:hypothetical protein PhCBS80983_g06160 [Powellomyces hirtus]|uniref:25S rRNA adenine-N(1) methyltransferase n=1 Tax=Powellomyces hirtus TaxID=109895 RepID=A0A507DQ18_9FUNG|nr:hypothetical protein PhCBS80983_g06160 [Powellomyces hirtus]
MVKRKTKKPAKPLPLRVEKTSGVEKTASTQKLISTYHTLNKQLSAVLKAGDAKTAATIRSEMEALGGLHAYQRASLKGGNEKKGLGACGSWLVTFLREEQKARENATAPGAATAASPGAAKTKLRLLDVGAVSGQTYAKQASWIDVSSIDLNPQSQTVKKQDFFERPNPKGDDERFHVLCLSLVVNFVGDPKLRGEMLIHARRFLLPSGLLFLVLPLPCVTNSRYMTHEHLLAIITSIGYTLVKQHFARKLAFYLLRRVENGQFKKVEWAKKEIHPGIERNNFCIVIRKD